MKTKNLAAQFAKLLGAGASPNEDPFRLFHYMDICEQEITIASKGVRRKDVRDRINTAFAILRPGRLSQFGDELYRAHCKELLARVKLGEDTRPGTDAELMTVLCKTSLDAPLTQDGCALYARLFARWFKSIDVSDISHPRSPQDVDQHEATLRIKLAADWRVLPAVKRAA